MSVLQGFEEVNMTAPRGKLSMLVTKDVVRFNKATAIALGYPAYVKVLINDKTKQFAVKPCKQSDANAVKFSKPEGKQIASVNIKDVMVLNSVLKYFKLDEPQDGQVTFQSMQGTFYPEERVAMFSVADAKAGVMKKRGRKKSESEEA